MFDGYLSLGGTEIINSERLAAYVRNVLPTLPLKASCCDCEDLSAFLGDDPYSSPLQDEPPWFSPFRTESAEFLGLLPLSMEGFEDSTREVSITEVTGDGSVSSRPRRASRDVRVTALMVAASEKGMELGMSWLRDALAGSGCADGDCSGDDLCYLSACPSICEDDLVVDILDLNTTTLTSAQVTEEAAEWQTTSGTITSSYVLSKRVMWVDGMVGPTEVSRTVTGLTPGAVYRVNASMLNGVVTAGATYMELSIAGSSYSTTSPRIFGPSGQPDTSGAMLEFTATSQTHRVVITPRGTTVDATADPGQAFLTVLTVERVPARSVLMAGPVVIPNVGSANAWTIFSPVSGYTTIWSGDYGGASFSASGAQSPALHSLGTSRSITGLTPGRDYKVRLGLRALRAGTTTPTLVTLGVKTTEGAWVDTVASPTWTGTNQGDTVFYTYNFTAASPTTTLTVANGTAMTMAASSQYTIEISYLRVEEDLSGEIIQPVGDNSRPLRTLRQVVTTSGPTVAEVYPPRAAYLQRVEWTMNAGAPRPVAESILVSTSLGMGTITIPEVDCYNGQQVIQNLITNPSFETNTTGWTATGTNWTLSRVVDPLAASGTYVGRLTASPSTSAGGGLILSPMTLQPGVSYSFSAVVGTSVSGTTVSITAAGTGWSRTVSAGALSGGAKGTRVSVSFYLPQASVNPVTLRLTFQGPGGTMPSGGYAWVDAVMLTTTSYPTQYVDGSVSGGTWAGTAHASTSTWRNPSASVVVDPACPPPPNPPRPPVILNDCVAPSDLWLRYAVDVPSEVTQQGTSAFPVTTLTTGATAARGVRARIYPNPFRLAADQIDPCSYCGEFLLSYLPPNAALTVDASLRDAWLIVDGQRQTAMQLLYGSDGGPITWPEMDCGVPYLLTLDVDADTPPLIGLKLDVTPAF